MQAVCGGIAFIYRGNKTDSDKDVTLLVFSTFTELPRKLYMRILFLPLCIHNLRSIM